MNATRQTTFEVGWSNRAISHPQLVGDLDDGTGAPHRQLRRVAARAPSCITLDRGHRRRVAP
jgi:hypothetical protein